MLVIPAIDLRGGRAVRLTEGQFHRETVYSDDPPAMARSWADQGAEMIHLVDLDGALAGAPQNMAVVEKIRRAVRLPLQMGGGIRSMATIETLLGSGIDRVILGTAAIRQPDLLAEACQRFGERIVVGIDSREGKVQVQGWADTTEKNDIQLALEMKALGLKRVVFTDTGRDGTLQGPNFQATGEMARQSGLRVIASGGVASLADIRQLQAMEGDGVEAVILGKSLYAGCIALPEAIRAGRGEVF